MAADKITFDSPNMPAQITAGETFTASLNVKKPNIKGKFNIEMTLPQGCTITKIPDKSAGAQFTGGEGNAIYEWENLINNMINIEYNITIPTDYDMDTFKIEGRFIYYEKKKRFQQQFTLPPIVIKKTINTKDNKLKTEEHRININVVKPQQSNAGERFRVSIAIDKPNINGVFKMILSMPEETLFDTIGNGGATMFKWTGLMARYTWEKGANDHIDIAYRVTPSPDLAGEFKTDVMFVYDNDEEEYHKFIVKIINGNETNKSTEEEEDYSEYSEEEKPAYTEPTDSNSNVNQPLFGWLERKIENSKNMVDNANIYVIRQNPYRTGNIVEARLQINRSNYEGYGHLVEHVQGGFVSIVEGKVEGKGANVTWNETSGEISFEWENVPTTDSIITLKYEFITANPEIPVIDGTFYFGENEPFESTPVIEKNTLIIKDLSVPDELYFENISPNIPTISKKPRKDKKKNDSHANDEVIKRCNNNQRLVYRVQIMATRKELTYKELKTYLRKTNADNIIDANEVCKDYIENDVNWGGAPIDDPRRNYHYKYMAGENFSNYGQASILRDQLQRVMGFDVKNGEKYPRAYLVCYSYGNRIRLQDARIVQGGRHYEY
jgi:hypothetical protein